jgi:hypothetical protein
MISLKNGEIKSPLSGLIVFLGLVIKKGKNP